MVEKHAVRNYLMLTGVGFVLLFLWWNCLLKDQSAANRWVLESGTEQSFTAGDDRTIVRAIGFCNDNAQKDVFDAYEECIITGTAVIRDSDGSVIWEKRLEQYLVPTLRLQTDLVLDEPISLQKGERYYVQIEQDPGKEYEGVTWIFEGNKKSWGSFYLALALVFWLVCSLAYWYYCGYIRVPFGICWIGFLLVISIASMCIMVPPCVPDEELHFGNAYAVSTSWMEFVPALRERSTEVPSGVLRMVGYDGKETLRMFWTDWNYGNQTVQGADGYQLEGMMPHYSYAVSALGITICRILRAPYQLYIIAAREMNVLLYGILTLLAMKLFPAMKKSVAAISLLPSCLWIINSCSYDVWNLGFCILYVCYCGRCAQKERVRIREMAAAVLLFAAFAPIKFIYVNFLLMVLLINRKSIAVRHKRAWLFGFAGILTGGVAAVLIARGQEVLAFLGRSGFDLRAGIGMDTTYTITWVVLHPLSAMLTYIKTLYAEGGDLLIKLFMGDQFMNGIPMLLAIGIILSFAIVVCGDTVPSGKRQRWISGAVVASGIVIVMSSFLFVYSFRPESGIGTIKGMQGRYFIPYLVCVPFLLPHAKCAEARARRALLLLCVLTIGSLMTRFAAVICG